MADETELAPEAGTEPLTPPAEGETTTEQQQQDPIEALAGDMGWVPQDQWRGDPNEWKPPADFIKAGREINRSMARELKNVREEVSRIARTSADMTAQAIAERDAYWRGQHRQAVEDGNVELAERAVEERARLKDQTPAQQNSGPPAETLGFIERHKSWMGTQGPDGKWTGGDPLARVRAMEIANQLAAQGEPYEEQLRQAERLIRKEFPEHFPQTKQPAAVQTGRSRNSGQGSGKKGFADMPAESQRMAQDYLKRHGMPLERFAESYWADQAQNERKVG